MIESLTFSASSSAFGVREVCTTLGISPSGFYAHRHKAQRPRRCQDRVLSVAMHDAFEQSGDSYGSPRLVRALRKVGLCTSKTRVRRLMKSAGLCPVQKRRVRVKTTQSNPHLPVAPTFCAMPLPSKSRVSGFTATSLTSRHRRVGFIWQLLWMATRAGVRDGAPQTTWKHL